MNAHSHTGFENVDQEARLPNGRYLMEIVESDAVNHGSAIDLVLTAEVIRGDHAGKRIAFRLLLDAVQDPDDTVDAEFSGRDLVEYASLCRATGLDNPTFVEDFHNRPFSALVSGCGRKQMLAGFEGLEFGIEPANDDAPALKQTRPTPPRGPDGRFLPRGHAEPDATEQADERKPWDEVSAWTPEQRFMFDLEGDLYKMVALATTLEALLTPITNGMSKYDRPMGAALDHAVVNLADAVEELEERYRAVRFPEKEAEAA